MWIVIMDFLVLIGFFALPFREFINSLRLYRSFYGDLADQLCVNELAAAEGLPCWNGEDVVKRYFICGGLWKT
jgi:hypothetical protein